MQHHPCPTTDIGLKFLVADPGQPGRSAVPLRRAGSAAPIQRCRISTATSTCQFSVVKPRRRDCNAVIAMPGLPHEGASRRGPRQARQASLLGALLGALFCALVGALVGAGRAGLHVHWLKVKGEPSLRGDLLSSRMGVRLGSAVAGGIRKYWLSLRMVFQWSLWWRRWQVAQ